MSFRKLILLPESRYNKLTSHSTVQDEEVSQGERLSQDIILKAIPKNFRVRAEALLEHLSHVNELSWNNRGTLLFNERVILHSNISDLLRYSMREYTHFSPVGLEEYVQGLVNSNVPESLIGNRELAETVRLSKVSHGEEKEDTTSIKSPPGYNTQQVWTKY